MSESATLLHKAMAMMRNFNELLCYYILDTILYSDKQKLYGLLDSNL